MGKIKKILMLTPSFWPERGGVERHVFEVSRELRAMGWDVAIVTGGLEKGYPREERVDGIEVVRLREETDRRWPFIWRIKSWGELWRRRDRIGEADVIHCHDYRVFLRWYLPFRILFAGKPVFMTFHGYEGYPLSWRVIWLRKGIWRLCTGSIGVGGFIGKYYGTPCDHTVIGGVRMPRSGEGPKIRNGAVYLGRLEEDMAIDRYLDVIETLRRDHGIKLVLKVLGDGSLKPSLYEEANRRALDIRFYGWVDDPFPFLAGARLALVDSYLAILEAMACRTPVFSICKNPLKRDYLEEFSAYGEVLEVRGDPRELARDISGLLKAPEKYADRVEKAFAMALEHSWEKVARSYLDLYGETLV